MSDIRTRILKAAENEFAKKGFAGVRMDEVARLAKVNKATVYYQIGQKMDLYRAVLDRLLGPVVGEIEAAVREVGNPAEKIKVYIHSLGMVVHKSRNLLPIFLRILMDGSVIELDELPFPKIFILLTAILAEGVKKGVFKKVPAFLVHFQIMGTFGIYTLTGSFRKKLCTFFNAASTEGADLNRDELILQVTDQVLSYLTSRKEGAYV